MAEDRRRIGVVEVDSSLQALICRIATASTVPCEVCCGLNIAEVDSTGPLDVLVYDTGTGMEQIEAWRGVNPQTKLILLVEGSEHETWDRISSLSAAAVLPIPFDYKQLRSVL